jgi:hypothetical protein
MENKMNLIERSGACTRGAKPEPNSVAEQRALLRRSARRTSPLKGRGELGGGNVVSHPR